MSLNLQQQTRWALILLRLVPALWSVNYIVARKAPDVIGPHLLAAGSLGFGGRGAVGAVVAWCM